jgi:hypothetical protein
MDSYRSTSRLPKYCHYRSLACTPCTVHHRGPRTQAGRHSQKGLSLPPTEAEPAMTPPCWLASVARGAMSGTSACSERRILTLPADREHVAVNEERKKSIAGCERTSHTLGHQTGRGTQGTRLGRRARMNKEYETIRTGRGLGGARDGVPPSGRGSSQFLFF